MTIDHCGAFRRPDAAANLSNPVTFNKDVDISYLAFVDETHITDKEFTHLLIMKGCRVDYHRNESNREPDLCGTRYGVR